MAKSKKNNQMGLILNIIIIALAVLTVCTLFMPIFKSTTVATDIATSATGADGIKAMFAGDWDAVEGGSALLYGFKVAEDTAFVTNVALWGYFLTVLVSVATLVFAVLNVLGMKFKLVNTVLGIALVILALVTFIFAIVVASKNTAIKDSFLGDVGVKCVIHIGMYFLIATMACGGLQVFQAKRK
ncbi:MAG: hypothetical protein IJW59_01570 [Clostridia bacterium]|nr:hypothetical protein [Clostridia bacterium]